jgi:hypothetical protein
MMVLPKLYLQRVRRPSYTYITTMYYTRLFYNRNVFCATAHIRSGLWLLYEADTYTQEEQQDWEVKRILATERKNNQQ